MDQTHHCLEVLIWVELAHLLSDGAVLWRRRHTLLQGVLLSQRRVGKVRVLLEMLPQVSDTKDACMRGHTKVIS